jgi:hypothetical protein
MELHPLAFEFMCVLNLQCRCMDSFFIIFNTMTDTVGHYCQYRFSLRLY